LRASGDPPDTDAEKEFTMKLNLELGQVTGVALTVASLLVAASCARDERALTLDIPRDVDNTLSSTNDGAATSSTPRSRLTPSAAGLSIATTAVNPGRMTAGFTAQTGIRADDIGSAPLMPLAIAFAEGSDPADSRDTGSAGTVAAGTVGVAAAGAVGEPAGGTGGAAGAEHENCNSARGTRSSIYGLRERVITTRTRFMAGMRCRINLLPSVADSPANRMPHRVGRR
jgi:hypothetical protein